jgi:lipoate-protein ligase B
MREPMVWEYHGLRAYDDALALQAARWRTRSAGGPDTCIALEHPPTVTLGRRATADDLAVPEATLAARGVTCVRVERGGRATYHGPGQLVLYPIVHLAARGFGIASFIWTLEEIMIDVAAAFGVRATRDPRGRGVWAAHGKLGAVGIRVRDGISTHGLALNVSTDLGPYRWIVPCGLRALAVSSLVNEGAHTASMGGAVSVAEAICARRLGGSTFRGLDEEARL